MSPGRDSCGILQSPRSIRMRAVEDAIRKPPSRAFANVREDGRVEFRALCNSVERSLHLGRKLWPESGALPVIEIEGFVKLRLRFGAEDNGQAHFRALASARALIISHGLTAS